MKIRDDVICVDVTNICEIIKLRCRFFLEEKRQIVTLDVLKSIEQK